MNTLPAELRTPPLPVIAFVGCPELHKDVGTFFNATLRPPLFSVGLAEASESLLGRLFGAPRPPNKPFSTPDGILKADWFSKQRQRRAAVAVAFVPRPDVEGDPSSWMAMLASLRAVKAASGHRDVALLLVVVQDGPVTELPQDRVAALWSNVEPRHVAVISRQLFDPELPPEQRRALQEEQLAPLGRVVLEAASSYYSAAAARLRQRQLDLAATLGACPPEVAAACAFKLAVLAEFRQDWQAAVASYQAAAAALQGVPLGRPTVSVQRHAEVTAVAEVVHFKALMLLLHQQRHVEAIAQLRSHLASFGRAPDGLPLPAAAAHCGWLARQYQTAAEVIAASRMDAATLQAHKEVNPAHLLLSAAQLALTRKALAEQLAQLRASTGGATQQQQQGGSSSVDPALVRRGRYMGQFEFKQPPGPGRSSDLTDAEFCSFLDAEERRMNHCQSVLELLLQAQAMHLRPALTQQQQQQPGQPAASAARGTSGGSSMRLAVDRVSARLAYLIAEQQAEGHNLTAARKLLLQAAYTYRRDGWDGLLLHTLLLLRDVCQRLKLSKEALLASLEVASLAASLAAAPATAAGTGGITGLFDHEQAQALAAAAVMGLQAGPTDTKSSLKQSPPPSPPQQQPDGQAADGAPSPSSATRWDYSVQHLDLPAALQQQQLPAGKEGPTALSNSIAELLLLHKQQDSGWWRLISVAGGFVTHSSDPQQLCLCVALLNNTPAELSLQSVCLTLADSQGHWSQQLAVGLPPQDAAAGGGSADAAARALGALSGPPQQQQQQQQGWPLQLSPGCWQLLHAAFAPRCIGSVVCEQLELQLGQHVCVAFKVVSFPPGRPALGTSVLPAAAGDPFPLQRQVKLGAWSAKVQHVGPLPAVQVLQPDLLLVGEWCPLEVRVWASAPQPPCSLELSVRSSGAAGGGASGAAAPQHLTLLAALPDGKLHETSLEGQVLAVPKLAAGAGWTQRLWVRSSSEQQGCRIAAVLSCPALVAAHADLTFRPPFLQRVRLCAEAGMHMLVAPSPAYAAVNNGDADKVAGSSSSSDASGVPLVVGQSLLAQVLVAASCPAELLLIDAAVELDQASGLKLLNSLADQLRHKPLPVSAGGVHSLLLQLVPTAKAAAPISMGALKLTWRRRSPAAVVVPVDGGSVPAAAAAAAAAGSEGGGLAVGAAPSEEVETWLELPAVLVQDSLLAVKASAPQHVTAGLPFAFTMQVHNMTAQPQEVQLSVTEAPGFVFSGSKQQVLSVPPRGTHNTAWTLVAHASGQLQLPAVRIACSRLSCSTVTQGSHIHVMAF